ncbi:hypothetical protein L2E82_43842 [Cichorium intybus]|uniref:Uncharacterized protein n=1 Tax=Cichorium intybus TaxID=13427 RepID=A0ACB8ZNA9_CICIN|nr:hypothetical protein L2E82_43842 [Cichorium intybus]
MNQRVKPLKFQMRNDELENRSFWPAVQRSRPDHRVDRDPKKQARRATHPGRDTPSRQKPSISRESAIDKNGVISRESTIDKNGAVSQSLKRQYRIIRESLRWQERSRESRQKRDKLIRLLTELCSSYRLLSVPAG